MPIVSATIAIRSHNLTAPVTLVTNGLSGTRMPVRRCSFAEWIGWKSADLNTATPSIAQQWDYIRGDAEVALASRLVTRQTRNAQQQVVTLSERVTEGSLISFALAFRTSLKAKVTSFITDCIGAQLTAKQDGATELSSLNTKLAALVGDTALPQLVRNLRTMVPGGVNTVFKRNLIEAVNRWCNEVQDEIWREWMKKEIARLGAAERPLAAADLPADSTGCEVYIVREDNSTVQIGDQETAGLGTAQVSHAEMKWKAANTDDFDAALDGAKRVEFHITRVPCDDGTTCARALIEWWQGRPSHPKAYIYTHRDDYAHAARKSVYRLTRDAILAVGTWT